MPPSFLSPHAHLNLSVDSMNSHFNSFVVASEKPPPETRAGSLVDLSKTPGSSSLNILLDLGDKEPQPIRVFLPTLPGQSFQPTHIRSTGRGGHGNIHEIHNPIPLSSPSLGRDGFRSPEGRESAFNSNLGTRSTGRGGAGNIRNMRAALVTGASEEERRSLAEREQEVLAKYRSTTHARSLNMRVYGRAGYSPPSSRPGSAKSSEPSPTPGMRFPKSNVTNQDDLIYDDLPTPFESCFPCFKRKDTEA